MVIAAPTTTLTHPQIITPTSLTEADILQIARIWLRVFTPLGEPSLANEIADVRKAAALPPSRDSRGWRAAVVRDDEGRIVSVATSYEHAVDTPRGRRPVLALAGVGTLPEHRGQGLGQACVRRMFDRVDRGDFPLALFQTAVHPFYERMGCRQVHNRFINTTAPQPFQRPWTDPQVMIYPHHAPWPEGTIDLRTEGY